MCDKKIDLLEFPLFTKSFILDETELQDYGNNLINILSDDQIKLMRRFKRTIYSIYSNEVITKYPYAIAIFNRDKLESIEFNLNKSIGETGLRITKKLKNVLNMKESINFNFRNLIRDELNNYFGKGEDFTTKYKSQSNFIIDLIKLKDSLKAIDLSKNTGYQANTNDAGADININDFVRSLDSKALPFHRLEIDYSVIQKALESLSKKNYSILQLFYFSDRKAKYNATYLELELLRENNYHKAWKLKNSSIFSLIDNICNIQYLESELNNVS